MKKVFISYSSSDSRKMTVFRDALSGSTLGFEPIVVAQTETPGRALSDKVKEGIKKSDYFVPILTVESITNQWVNQEIGFAESLQENLTVLPIVDTRIIANLKGFINNQLDLPFSFTGEGSRRKKESLSFKTCYESLIKHIEIEERGFYFKSHLVKKKIRAGEAYTTVVSFKGDLKHGFFDNKITRPKKKVMWNWDKKSLPDARKTEPGKLNGSVDIVKRRYTCKTSDWEKGEYSIQVGVYQHKEPGIAGRTLMVKEMHTLELV